jgi:hypothetical protein
VKPAPSPHRRQLVAEARRLERLLARRRALRRTLAKLDAEIRSARFTVRAMSQDID